VKTDSLVIGLSALPGGGKDYVADILSENYGFYKISPGDIIREKLSKMKKGKISREEQQKLQNILRKKYGKDYVMELCLKRIKKLKKDKVAISGIRFPNDIKFFKKQKGIRFYNIFIHAPVKVRFERTMTRKRIDAPGSYREFLDGDRNEKRIFNLNETEKNSDFKLENGKNNSIELKKMIKKIIQKTM
jgi:dephospho-CoA kinase